MGIENLEPLSPNNFASRCKLVRQGGIPSQSGIDNTITIDLGPQVIDVSVNGQGQEYNPTISILRQECGNCPESTKNESNRSGCDPITSRKLGRKSITTRILPD